MKDFYYRLCGFCLMILLAGSALAQDFDEVPVRGPMYFSDNMFEGNAKKASTRADDKPWTFVSVIENCYDKTAIGKSAWLMTADAKTQLKISLTYNGSDAGYKIVDCKPSFYFYQGNDLLHDPNKQLITDVGNLVGTVNTQFTKNQVNVIITAPRFYPETPLPYYTFYMILSLEHENGGTSAAAMPLGISRCGLFLLHGLNDSYKCFMPYKKYLVDAQRYLDKQIYLGDYRISNTASFYENTHNNKVVAKGLMLLSAQLFNLGIASTRYDMIGHSMGGILLRLHNQEVDNTNANKLITLNTPHLGARLGNVYDELTPTLEDKEMKENWVVMALQNQLDKTFDDDSRLHAVTDLAIGSEAIINLNGASRTKLTGIPCCAVGTEIDWVNSEGIKYTVKKPFYDTYALIMLRLFEKKVNTERKYLDENADGTDAVVSVESQIGRCEKSYIYKGTWGYAYHSNAPTWEVVQKKLTELLTEVDQSRFSYYGFGSVKTSQAAPERKADEKTEYVTSFADPKPSSFIRISAEARNANEYTHEIKLTHSNDMATYLAYCILPDSMIIADFDKDNMYFNFEDFEGEATIYTIGRTNYDALLMDSVKVMIEKKDGIALLQQTPALQYSMQGNQLKVENMSGPYTLTIYDLGGSVLAQKSSNPAHLYALPENSEYLILEVRTADEVRTAKIKTR